jgi:hypothetical protein
VYAEGDNDRSAENKLKEKVETEKIRVEKSERIRKK